VIIIAEAVTALIYLYLGLSLPLSSWTTLPGVLRELHFITVIVGAIVVAWATARCHPWSAKVALVLAAYTNLPNLAAIAGFVAAIPENAQPAAVLSLSLVFLTMLLQLTVFVLVFRQLRWTEAAG
jgi:hypothetical protein